jgi:hypothetical protein
VKDINNKNPFISDRKKCPNNPLNPVYQWRDSVEFGKMEEYQKGKERK